MHILESSMLSDLFSIQIPYPEKILRTIAVYLAIAIVLRIFGKRLMAQMNSLDLVVVLLLSNVVQNAIIGEDNSLVGGLVGAATLVIFNALLDRVAHHFPAFRFLLEGKGDKLVEDGKINEGVMHRLGMSDMELRTALRQQGADAIEEVHVAEIEPGGQIAVTLKRDDQNASYAELRAAVDELKAEIRALHAPR